MEISIESTHGKWKVEVESDKERDKIANRDKEETELDKELRKLRSGRIFNLRLETLPERFKEKVIRCTRRWLCIPCVHVAKVEERLKSCLKRKKYREVSLREIRFLKMEFTCTKMS